MRIQLELQTIFHFGPQLTIPITKKNRILKEAMDTKWYVHEYEDWSGVSNYLRTLTTNFGSKKLNKNIAL